MKQFSTKPFEILLVEDNEVDVLLTIKAFKSSKIANNIHVVNNGEDALSYLRREGFFSDAVKPDLVLLDINLPKKNGTEVLKEAKEDPMLRMIPIVILTSSQSEQDVVKKYGLHINNYLIKPIDISKISQVLYRLL